MDKVTSFFNGLLGNKTKTPTSTNNTIRLTNNRNTRNKVPRNTRSPLTNRNTGSPLTNRNIMNKIPRNTRPPLTNRNIRNKVPRNTRPPLTNRNTRSPLYGGKKKPKVMTKQTRKIDGVTRIVRKTKTGRKYVLLHGHRRYL